MLALTDYLFYFLALVSFVSACGVILTHNPIHSALWLVMTMGAIAGLFVTLNAWFVAGVQLIVYAGAVMVLFVMVMMLFDIRKEVQTFSRGIVSGFLKLVAAGLILGFIAGPIYMSAETVFTPAPVAAEKLPDVTTQLSQLIFTKYLFAFEVIGVLVLVIAVGAVTLSRISGGTHAND